MFNWDDQQKQGLVSAGVVRPPDSGSTDGRLEVNNGNSTPLIATVLTIDSPNVAGPRYRLTGRIRYENVEGAGYLEMWNCFPGGGQYFSRTLADQGPMMKLQGTSGWRTFVLPFDATGAPPPTRLVLNVVLPARGTVSLGPLALSDDGGGAATGLLDGSADRLVGLVGGVGGATIGGLGALMGVLVSLGRARRFVIAAAIGLIVCGTLAFLGAIAALASGRAPSGVYPVLLMSFVSSFVPLMLLRTIRKRYEEIELRLMRAHDLGGG